MATVTTVSPLTVTIDGATSALPAINASRNPWPTAGQRCLYQTAPGLIVVTALLKSSGTPPTFAIDDGSLAFSGTGASAEIQGLGSGFAFLNDWVLKRDGRHATIYAVWQNSGVISMTTTGNVANKNILQILDSRFIPSFQQGLGSDGSGRGANYQLDTTGIIEIASATGTADIASGESLSIFGTYRLG